MSSKRVLKKEITRICGAMAGECMRAEVVVPGIDPAKCDQIIVEIAQLQDNALRRLSIHYPKAKEAFDSGREYRAARGAYYQQAYAEIKKEFNDHVSAILKEMNALLPATQKEANKTAAK